MKAKDKARLKKHKAKHFATVRISIPIIMIIIFLTVYLPNIGLGVSMAKQAHMTPSDAWCSSLSWMKNNTPDPFGNPNYYYEPYSAQYPYPESAYGVMAWWDYGYWIARIAHRLPNACPGQEPEANRRVAQFFIAQDEETANAIMDDLDSNYVIVDRATATSKFYAIVTWAGRDIIDYYVVEDRAILYFTDEYYQSMAVRLFENDGEGLECYRLIHSSADGEVKIFEYIGGKR